MRWAWRKAGNAGRTIGLMLGLMSTLAACAAGPGALGITGPGQVAPPPSTGLDDGRSPAPGTPDAVGGYSTHVQQSPGPDGQYFNYN